MLKSEFINARGRGYKKIREGFEGAGLPMPKIEATYGGVKVTFLRNNVNIQQTDSTAGENVVIEMSDVLKDVHKDVLKELTERQLVILETICTSPNVTQQGMSTKLKVSKKTIQREFDAIRNLGINIDRQDGRKEGEWVIKTEK